MAPVCQPSRAFESGRPPCASGGLAWVAEILAIGWLTPDECDTLSAMPEASQYQAYPAWDAPTRWFHWINALTVLGLIIVGVILWNDDALGLSANGKILLKQIHVVLGYVMILNLLWRFV
jgi:hypothetical protein